MIPQRPRPNMGNQGRNQNISPLEARVDGFKVMEVAKEVVDFKTQAQQEIDKALQEIKSISQQATKAVEEVKKISSDIEPKFEEVSNEVVDILKEIKSQAIQGEKGDKGEKGDTPIIDVEKIAEVAAKKVKPTPASLKIIKESIDFSGEELVPKLNKAKNIDELSLSIKNIKDWDKQLGDIKTEISRNKGGFHGGGFNNIANAISTVSTGLDTLKFIGSGVNSVTQSGRTVTVDISAGAGSGITSINADTTVAQVLSVGTSGTDFAIADNGTGTHTFNLPTASATNRGALSSADWTTFNNKGSGTVTSVASADGSITVTNPTTTPNLSVVKSPVVTTTINTGVTMAGYVITTAIADPASPPPGKGYIYQDLTHRVLNMKNEAGVVSNTVIPLAAVTHKFLTSVGADGTVTQAQPAAADLSAGTFGTGAYTMDTSLTVPQIFNADNNVTATANAATITRANRNNVVTNNSAATLTITLSTTGATAGDMLVVQVLDFSAVAQTITWVNTENGPATVPGTSNGSTTLPISGGFKWNPQTSKWRCMAAG